MLRIFQSSFRQDELIEFDHTIAMNNHKMGRQTNIIFDTNVMIDIDSAYRTNHPHTKLKEAGIVRLVEMIAKYSKYGIFISPAAAYRELPPARRGPVEVAFNRMIKDYLPQFRSDPNATNLPFADEGEAPETFSELSSEMQQFKACSYASLLATNIIYRLDNVTPLEKLDIYVDYCSEVMNLIGLKELAIARYVFAPDQGITDSLRKRKNAILSNFTKIKKGGARNLSSSEIIKRVALNGTNDLSIILAADVVNNTRKQFSDSLIEHDAWIATSDEKLYEFCRACPSILLKDSTGAMARSLDPHLDITGTAYWKKSAEVLERRLEERRGKANSSGDMSAIVQSALQTEALLVKGEAESFFITRPWQAQL